MTKFMAVSRSFNGTCSLDWQEDIWERNMGSKSVSACWHLKMVTSIYSRPSLTELPHPKG